MTEVLNQPKTIRAWTMYDWANSVFSLTIATAIFPPYYESISKAASIAQGNSVDAPYYLNLFGFQILNTSLYSYALSLSFLLVAICSPILSGIADVRRNKKFFMQLFCYLGSASCILMYFVTPATVYLGLILFVIALLGFAGSIVFYNAFLPEIASEDQFDRVSARGYSLGYVGSVILLLINLVSIMFPHLFFPVQAYADELLAKGTATDAAKAFEDAKDHYAVLASRLSFVSVGLWWAGFAQITFFGIKEDKTLANKDKKGLVNKGFHEIKKVWNEIQHLEHARIKRYLWGFFFTSMGLQTVMYIASIFGSQELHLPTQDLIITVLIIQCIGIFGAWSFSRISERIGNISTLVITIVIWIFITLAAYFIQNKIQFYALGGVVGLVMGGIQSLCRSTYAKLIPENSPDHASYFSFYDVSEKIAIVLGTLVYGLLNQITGSMRMSVLALMVFFIIGLFFIARIKHIQPVKV